jgi:hypothetical protein
MASESLSTACDFFVKVLAPRIVCRSAPIAIRYLLINRHYTHNLSNADCW